MAKALANSLKLPIIHLDQEYWQAGWVESPLDLWKCRVDELLKIPRWVMDGNYGGTLEKRLAVCDAVVFLDLSRQACFARVFRRRIMNRGQVRSDVAEAVRSAWNSDSSGGFGHTGANTAERCSHGWIKLPNLSEFAYSRSKARSTSSFRKWNPWQAGQPAIRGLHEVPPICRKVRKVTLENEGNCSW